MDVTTPIVTVSSCCNPKVNPPDWAINYSSAQPEIFTIAQEIPIYTLILLMLWCGLGPVPVHVNVRRLSVCLAVYLLY